MILTVDLETYFDDEYTLSKMTTEAYVRDKRFEIHGAAIKWGQTGATKWYEGDEVPGILSSAFTNKHVEGVLFHHAHFDGLALSHHHKLVPNFYYDTLPMARMLIGNHLSASLDNLAKNFNLQAKNVPYHLFKGRHWHEIPEHERQQVRDGACHDVDLTWDIFCILAGSFPSSEYALVDATVRMFTQPVLVGNTPLLAKIWRDEADAKAALLAELGVTLKDLGSNEKFANLLRAEDIEPEMKAGKADKDGNDREIYAFAKTDDFMRDLIDHEDDRVALLAQARLEAKSNAIQTRSERFGWMATRGAMPVYLNYAGTHLAGWSGGDASNWQNLKRGGPIAEAIEAPLGNRLVIADASQIECRLLNEIAGQHDVIERFRNKEDPYTSIASRFYGFEVTKAHEKERGTGKQLELSCGYGAGGPTIKATAKKGTYGPPVYLSDEQALQARDLYRETHPAVVALWNQAGDVLKRINAGLSFEWGPVTIKDKFMWLPTGIPLHYDTLEWFTADNGDQFWRIKSRRGHVKLYGAKLVENLIQALRNQYIREAWLRLMSAGMRMVSMEHDKLIAVVAEKDADAALAYMQQEMSRPPIWLPNVPLASEGYISHTFAKEKSQ